MSRRDSRESVGASEAGSDQDVVEVDLTLSTLSKRGKKSAALHKVTKPLRSLRRAGASSKAYKFKIDVTVRTLRCEASLLENRTPVLVQWERGNKMADTLAQEVYGGIVNWDDRLSQICTLYKPNNSASFDEKKCSFNVRQVTPKGRRTIGRAAVNLSEYSSLDNTNSADPIFVDLPIFLGSMQNGTLTVEIQSVWLSALSSRQPGDSASEYGSGSEYAGSFDGSLASEKWGGTSSVENRSVADMSDFDEGTSVFSQRASDAGSDVGSGGGMPPPGASTAIAHSTQKLSAQNKSLKRHVTDLEVKLWDATVKLAEVEFQNETLKKEASSLREGVAPAVYKGDAELLEEMEWLRRQNVLLSEEVKGLEHTLRVTLDRATSLWKAEAGDVKSKGKKKSGGLFR